MRIESSQLSLAPHMQKYITMRPPMGRHEAETIDMLRAVDMALPTGSSLDTKPAADHFNTEMVELALLLPRQQMSALETIAGKLNMTTGQVLRRLIAANLPRPTAV